MDSYLDLISKYSKAHKKQNCMTIICIIIPVFLVTTIFSLANIAVNMEFSRLEMKHGITSFSDFLSNTTVQTIYGSALFLLVLILIASVLMISNSMNTNISQRTSFFGMLRCIGMSKKQIKKYVRLESLNRCKTAIPIGIGLGIMITWCLCTILHFLVGEEFAEIPIFGISWIGIVCGVFVGLVTVLISSKSSARKASKVSPVVAISGVDSNEIKKYLGINSKLNIETTLGINTATSQKKRLFLMTGSFALCIILFLCFSVLIQLVNYLLPQFSSDSDIEIYSIDGGNSIESSFVNELSNINGVKNVYGRVSYFDLSMKFDENDLNESKVDLISYDDFDLDCLVKDKLLKRGSDISKVYGENSGVILVWNKNNPFKIGDEINLGGKKVKIAGSLKIDPFSDGEEYNKFTFISSKQTFSNITNIDGYSLVMIQLENSATEQNINEIKKLVGEKYKLYDVRDTHTKGTYTAFMFFVYGFLIIISIVTIFNIINTISMSVNTKMREYGVMKAVGMSLSQIKKMVLCETLSYALIGDIVGILIGVIFHKILYNILIEKHFVYASVWDLPILQILIVQVFIFVAVILAISGPIKKIKNISVIELLHDM